MAYFPFDVSEFDITQFQGSSQACDPYQLDSAHGLYSQNIDFIIGRGSPNLVQAASRRGSSQVIQLPTGDGGVLSLFPWYFNNAGAQDCYAVYYAPAVGAKAYSQRNGTFIGLIPVTAAKYLSLALNGIQAYFAFGDATGRFSSNPDTSSTPPRPMPTNLAPPFLNTNPTVTVTPISTTGHNCTAEIIGSPITDTTRNGVFGTSGPLINPGTTSLLS